MRRAFLPILLLLSALPASTEDAKKTAPPAAKPVRLALYAGDGIVPECVAGYERAVKDDAAVAPRRVTADEIRQGALKDFDVLIMPGGTASGERKALGPAGTAAVKGFVQKGGGYLGFCAGTYLSIPYDPGNLNLINAKVVDDEHWARGKGPVKIRLTPEGQRALGIKEAVVDIHYENGPLLAPGQNRYIPAFTPLAAFETEMRQNNAPEGVMKGTPAIVAGRYGRGRVLCFSPHPELTPGLETVARNAVRWAAGRPPAGPN